MTLSEKDFNKWWDSLTLCEKSETYWKMGDIFASRG